MFKVLDVSSYINHDNQIKLYIKVEEFFFLFDSKNDPLRFSVYNNIMGDNAVLIHWNMYQFEKFNSNLNFY